MFITSTASCLPLLLCPWRELAWGPASLGRGSGAAAALCSWAGSALLCPEHRGCCLGPGPSSRGLTGVTVLERGAGSGSRTPGGCSSSQLIPLFLAANAGAPLAVHEGPAAQGPDGVEHRVCHGFTGCGEGQDGQVRTGNPEHPCTELQGIRTWKRELLSFLSENCIFINPDVPSSPQGGTNFSPTKPLLSCLFQPYWLMDHLGLCKQCCLPSRFPRRPPHYSSPLSFVYSHY